MVNEGLQFASVAGDDAAIEADIDPTLALGSIQLLPETCHGGGGRDSVQRHVNDGGDTTKGSSLGACIEALPFGAAGLVQVNMGINQAGKQDIRRIVGIGSPFREVRGRNDGVKDRSDLSRGARDNDCG